MANWVFGKAAATFSTALSIRNPTAITSLSPLCAACCRFGM